MTGARSSQTVWETNREVAEADRGPDWWLFHELVVAEVRGLAPDGAADLLACDPYRWAAHLGVAIGDAHLRRQLLPPDSREHALASAAITRLSARKGDVVSLRKRDELERTRNRALKHAQRMGRALRHILDLAARADAGTPAGLERISLAATEAIERDPVDA